MPFGVTIRAVGTALLMAPTAAILARILGEVVPLFNAPNSMLAQSFNAISANALTIGLLSALVMVIAAAVTESRAGVR